jgi:antitoxin component of MazEF toxin-antitoxin module
VQTALQKVGEQLILEIPESFAKQAGLTENLAVSLKVTYGALVLRPLSGIETLEDLLAKVTDHNLHGEITLSPL